MAGRLENLHALQIEVNRGLYLNERTFEKSQRFDQLHGDLKHILHKLIVRTGNMFALPAAAE